MSGRFTVNNRGKIVGEGHMIQETISGRDVYLSIDKNLQNVVYRILEQELAGILTSNLIHAKRFDQSRITDTSHIRIPIYDVYLALINNHVIRLEAFAHSDATALEKSMAAALDAKREEVQEALQSSLLDETIYFRHFSEEQQEYLSYIVQKMGIFKEDAIDKEDEVYQKWEDNGELSIRTLLTHAIERGWIQQELISSKPGYFTTDEMYMILVEVIQEKLAAE